MKKWTKVLVSVLLVLILGVTTCLFTGVFSSAQAVATDVSVSFAGVDKEDWVVLNGTTIQDDDFKLAIANSGEKDIVITDISHTGHDNITFSNWTEGMVIKAGAERALPISGDTNNNSVFTATVTYHIKNYPDTTSETATAYIWCTTKDYITGHTEALMESGALVLGMNAGLNLYPVNVSSYTTTKVEREQGPFVNWSWLGQALPNNKKIYDPTTTTKIYVDKSHYKTWKDLGLKMSFNSLPFDKPDDVRQYVDLVGMDLTLSDSTTMSMSIGGYEASTLPSANPHVESAYDGNEGFYYRTQEANLTSITFDGFVPDEAVSHATLKLRGNGIGTLTDKLGGAISGVSADFIATWNITIYNNDKTALRTALTDLAGKGYNKESYNDSSNAWTNYEKALKAAYQVLGTIEVEASAVETALNNVKNAEAKLINPANNYRYAVVVTNHYYYLGKDDSNPVAINSHPTYNMKVVNGSTITPEILTNGDYSKPITNRNVQTSVKIEVDSSTNYTTVINQYYWNVNFDALNALIKEFKNKPTEDSQGGKIYKEDSWKAYADAVQVGEDLKLADESEVFQQNVDDACDAIIAARDALEREIPDTLWLSEGIDWAGQILDNSYIYEDYEYNWDTEELFSTAYTTDLINELEDAYDEANEVLSDPNYTKPEADAAAQSLWNAIYNLCVADNRGLLNEYNKRHADVDKYGYYAGPFDHPTDPMGLRPLFNDVIDNTSGDYRLNEEDFTADSWYALQDALYGNFEIGWYACATTEEPYPANNAYEELNVPAYSMINNIYFLATQQDYNDCRDNLLAKVNGLEYELDFTDLEIVESRIADLDLNDYTPSSAQALATELEKAQQMLDKLSEPQYYGDENPVSQAAINAQCEALENAEAALALKPFIELKDTAPEGVGIDEHHGYIYGENAGRTVKQLIEEDLEIVNNSEDVYIKVVDKNNKVVARSAKAGTGYKLELYVDDDLCMTIDVIITGDVNGDALIDSSDFQDIYNDVNGNSQTPLDGVFKVAADLNGDNIVDLCDAAMALYNS